MSGGGAFRVETSSGSGAITDMAGGLDALHASTCTPVTSRRRWLQAWVAAFPRSEPWSFVVREPQTGRVEAAALLCRREMRDGVDVAPLGFGRNDRSRLPARTAEAGDCLADAVATALLDLDRPWTLRVEQLPAGDRVAGQLVDALPVATLVQGGDVPRVQFAAGATGEPDAYVSKSLRKVLRKSRNRIEVDGLALAVGFERTPAGIEALVEEVERIHRERDHAVSRESDLDTEGGLDFWRSTILVHAAAGEAEVATLRLDGALAAYVVSFLDGDSYRVFDGRFATEWARYSPGRLLETSTLARAADDESFALLDWMNSVAPEKLVSANAVEESQHLVACSPDRQVTPEQRPDEVVLREHADHRPTADQALRALAGIGRAPGRRVVAPLREPVPPAAATRRP